MAAEHDSLGMRLFWLLIFLVVGYVVVMLFGVLVAVQVICRLLGRASQELARLGAGLAAYLAQIGRFASFHDDRKPWPFADWPAPDVRDGRELP